MDNTLRKCSNMRLGVGYPDDQYFVNDENIISVLANEKYQNNWLTGLIGCINYVKDRIKVENMVEIGSYQGESTTLFAHYLQPNKLYAIDPFVNGYDEFDGSSTGDFTNVIHNFNLRIQQFPCIKHIKNFSYAALDQFEDDSLDFVYVDGDHTYEGVVKDIKMYLPKIKVGGFIAGHDLGRESVTKALRNQLGEVDARFEDSSWVVQVTQRVKNNSKLHTIPNSKIGRGLDQPITSNDGDIEYALSKKSGHAKISAEGILKFFEYLKTKNIKRILELGAYQGENTELLAKYLNPESIWVCEKFESQPQLIDEVVNLQHAEENFMIRTEKYPCVKLIKFCEEMLFERVIENESIDLIVFSEHKNKDVLKDQIVNAVKKLKKPGYIAGIGWGSGDVVFACLETVGDVDLYFDDSSWVKEIK